MTLRDRLLAEQLDRDPTRAMIHAFLDPGERDPWLATLRQIRNLPLPANRANRAYRP